MTFVVVALLFVATIWYSQRYEHTGNLADIAIAAACAVASVSVAITGASR
jgi:hypothetical protein